MWEKIKKSVAQAWKAICFPFRWLRKKLGHSKPISAAETSLPNTLPLILPLSSPLRVEAKAAVKKLEFFNLLALPTDLITYYIAPRVDAPDLSRIVRSSRRLNLLFSPQLPVARLLRFIGDGSHADLGLMLQRAEQTPSLLLKLITAKGTVTSRAVTFSNISALEYAGWFIDFDTVKLLVHYGAHLKTNYYGGLTPLHLAVNRSYWIESTTQPHSLKIQNRMIVELLVQKNANVNAVSIAKITPLHYAVSADEEIDIEIAKLLINDNTSSASLKMIMETAKTNGHTQIEKLIAQTLVKRMQIEKAQKPANSQVSETSYSPNFFQAPVPKINPFRFLEAYLRNEKLAKFAERNQILIFKDLVNFLEEVDNYPSTNSYEQAQFLLGVFSEQLKRSGILKIQLEEKIDDESENLLMQLSTMDKLISEQKGNKVSFTL